MNSDSSNSQITAIVDYVNYQTTDFYNHFHWPLKLSLKIFTLHTRETGAPDDDNYYSYFDNSRLFFQQMSKVYDTAEDLKLK
jgi:hypothetical protein